MLSRFKQFADFVNRNRKDAYSWKETVKEEAKDISSVLEVGCNVRPLVSSSHLKLHDGIDPDPTIDLDKANQLFSNFYNIKFEDFDNEHQYDLIILDMVFEHLENNQITLDILKKCLKENGKILIHAPSNLHPFSILNQLIPMILKRQLLTYLRPWSRPGKITGWKSYYHKCNISSASKMIKSKKMKVERACFRYNGSDYFAFFPPLFLIIVCYEQIIAKLNVTLLSSHFMLIITHDD